MKTKKSIKVVAIAALTMFILSVLSPWSGMGTASEGSTKDNPEPFYYTVKDGDCLWNLAEKFDVELDVLSEVNGLNIDNILAVGEEIVIPSNRATLYKVKTGDTLFGIAERFGTRVESLVEKNRLEDEHILPVGIVLTVPVETPALAAFAGLQKRMPEYRVRPVRGIVSSSFGPRDGRMHEGLDIAAEAGLPVRTVDDGVVVFAGERGTYGNTVIINHGGGLRTLYAHASTLEVSAGDRVKEGQIIARVGNTGRSTGPHLHMEILYRGTPLNPEECLPTY